MTQSTPQAIYRKDYQAPTFLIRDVHLEFLLSAAATRVKNTMRLYRNPETSHAKDLVLHGENIQLLSVMLDGVILPEQACQVTDRDLTIYDVPDEFTLTVTSECNPENNTALEGLYISKGMFCTQCEPHGFRRITYYLDRPDVMAKFKTTIVAIEELYPVLLSNGNLIDKKRCDGDLLEVTWEDPFPKPCYLFALVAGDLGCYEDHFVTMSGRKITLQIYVAKGQESLTHHAMECLKLAMKWDEEKYGREYDLDIFMIVAASNFNMGAMENKGLNIFNAKYILADSETATDKDYEGIATVVAHEYFHNWTGNRITCRDWFQLSLKEGLTVYRDQEFTADVTSRPIARIDEVRLLTTRQFTEDGGPLAHPVRPESYIEMNNFYTMTIYHKGAEVVRMLATLEGEEDFRHGMDLYFDRHDGQAVTCDEFVNAHADANQKKYTQFMRWYSQAGTPSLTITDHYDEASKTYSLIVSQETKASADGSPKEPFHLPIRCALIGKDGKVLVPEKVLELTDAKQTFEFNDVAEKPIPSLMRNFSAPVNWHYSYKLDQMITLLHHDTDPYNRFHMGREIFYHIFNDQETIPQSYLAALKTILVDDKQDCSFRAQLLSFPSFTELTSCLSPIKVDWLIQRRQKMLAEIATFLAQDAYTIYTQLNQSVPYQFDQQQVGVRNLRFVLLRILFEANHSQVEQLAAELYTNANNMTDRYNALHLVVSFGSQAAAHPLLEDFHKRYQHNDLVMEKWLAVQAMRPMPTTLEHIQSLLLSPVFDYKNPNKVRALIGSYSQSNFIGFNLKEGRGYEWLAEQVLVVDELNPITAARLVEPLTRWRQYEDSYAVLMRSALQRIASHAKLSKDVYELVSKSL